MFSNSTMLSAFFFSLFFKPSPPLLLPRLLDLIPLLLRDLVSEPLLDPEALLDYMVFSRANFVSFLGVSYSLALAILSLCWTELST